MTQNRNLSIFADNVSSAGILGISGGGTGLSTTPSNGQLDIGNGSGFTRNTITAGAGISVTNGAGTITIASAVTQPQVYAQAFTSSGSWTAPTGVTRVRAWVIGGGGGGGFGASCTQGGGGAGGTAVGVYTVSPGTAYTVTIGAGGAGNASTTGATGGTSSFSSFCSATGGNGGGSAQGTSGTGSNGTIQNSTSQAPSYAFAAPAFTSITTKASGTPAVAAGGSTGAGNGSGPGIGSTGGIVYLEWVQ